MRLVVVGGVAGGMSAAARARRLDETAEIIVLERGNYVSFANCGLPYYVGGEIEQESSLLLHTPQTLREAFNLDVRIGHEVTGIDYAAHELTVRTPSGEEQLSYDALVLSPGGQAINPLPGAEKSPRVHTLRTVDDARALRGYALQGGTAVVIGGGFIGLEAAEAFMNAGMETHIVELADHVLPPLERELANMVELHLMSQGMQIHTGVSATGIADGASSATVTLSDGAEIKANVVVLAVGVRPDTEVFTAAGLEHDRGAIITDAHGRTNQPDVYAVGDSVLSTAATTGMPAVIALAGPANRAGRLIADQIFAPEHARELPPLLGTAIVRAGELTAAITGANRAQLERAEQPFVTIHLHPTQHAGYFPGASAVDLIVHFDPETGAILGAQGLGREGVDKRIDVIATAIRGALSVQDLIDLDLSYSPPYGSAKDPVNMAGMVGDNVLSGELSLIYADEIAALAADPEADTVVLDVRTCGEFEAGHLPGAINIPHTELRGRLDELAARAAGRKLAVMCAAGVRSWTGYRIVRAAGYEARMLSGGIKTLVQWFGAEADQVLVPGSDEGQGVANG